MKDLFYSKSEKILFLIIGYTNESQNVSEFIKALKEDTKDFLDMAEIPVNKQKEYLKKVNSRIIENSTRYKSMRLYWLNDITKAPKNSFSITNKNSWTMEKWCSV